MESLVVTLETAEKLKAAGFPHTQWVWADDMVLHFMIAPPDSFPAPTAQEIADQLPPPLDLQTNGEQWFAWHQDGDGLSEVTDDIGADGDTMSEALAALWLKLQEVK